MKALKIILFSFLVLHIFTLLIINFSGYKVFSHPDYIEKLNGFGKKVATNIEKVSPSDDVVNFVRAYSTYVGADRGYSFFSPNVSRSSIELQFVDNNGKELIIPFNSLESKLKFTTADSLFESYLIGNDELRDRILKSITKWLFTYNPEVTSIKVYLKLLHFEDLDSETVKEQHVQEDIFFGFTVERKKTNTSQL